MWKITAKKIVKFILSIVTIILFYYSAETNSKISPRGCNKESSRACWFEKKQQLNDNIARVCNKYADYIDKISGSSRVNRVNFLHHGNMLNCIIGKV